MTQKLNWFAVCYWSAAAVQIVGSFSVFGSVTGDPLHASAGALCFELFILALNAYGVKQAGKWMACICMLSLALIAMSAMFQVADLRRHDINTELASRLGPDLYAFLRVTVPAMPSVAMAGVTLIKFVDAKRGQIVATAAPDEQGEAFDPEKVLQLVETRMDAKLAEFAQRHPTQAVQVNFQQPAGQQAQPLQGVADVADVQAEPLQLASPVDDLQIALAELQGRPLVEALPVLTARGFSKSAVAAAIGKQPYELAPSKLKATELLRVGG
jgi:hypothetical protein